MSREIRQVNLAGMDAPTLVVWRKAVAKAIGDGSDFNHLLEDIDAEIARREPAKETA